jgi:hypothetical protein
MSGKSKSGGAAAVVPVSQTEYEAMCKELDTLRKIQQAVEGQRSRRPEKDVLSPAGNNPYDNSDSDGDSVSNTSSQLLEDEKESDDDEVPDEKPAKKIAEVKKKKAKLAVVSKQSRNQLPPKKSNIDLDSIVSELKTVKRKLRQETEPQESSSDTSTTSATILDESLTFLPKANRDRAVKLLNTLSVTPKIKLKGQYLYAGRQKLGGLPFVLLHLFGENKSGLSVPPRKLRTILREHGINVQPNVRKSRIQDVSGTPPSRQARNGAKRQTKQDKEDEDEKTDHND